MAPASIIMTRALAFAGALPFLASALLLWSGEKHFPLLGDVPSIAASYGLLILAFMAGIHWGQALSGVKTNFNLFIASNVIALAAWFASLLLSPKLFFAVLAALFAAVLMIDRKLAADGVLDRNYLATRTIVSSIVVLSLAVIALKV
jgi:hypothetical protein